MEMFPLTYRRLSGKVNNTLRKKVYRTSLEPMIYLVPLGKSPVYRRHNFSRLTYSPVTLPFFLFFFFHSSRQNCITLIKPIFE